MPFLVFFALCGLLPFGTASSIFVNSSSGQDTPSCGAVDVPCLTLQHGIDLARSGDLILATGVFSGQGNTDLSFAKGIQNVTLAGTPLGAQICCPVMAFAFRFSSEDETIKVANFKINRCLIAIGGEAMLSLIGLEFMNFTSPFYSTWIFVTDSANPVFSNCLFNNGSVSNAPIVGINGNSSALFEGCGWRNGFIDHGSVVRVDRPPLTSGSVTFRSCSWQNLTLSDSSVFLSAAFSDDDFLCETTTSTFENATFEAISCPPNDALGRVVQINGCGRHKFSLCQWKVGDVDRNDAMLHYFYSVFLQSFVGSLEISNSLFDSNAGQDGPAIYTIFSTGRISVNDTVFHNNTSYRGAVYLYEEVVIEFNRCNFTNNHASVQGGAVVVSLNHAPGKQGVTVIRDSLFLGNDGFSGSAIYAERQSLVQVIHCDFHNNTSFNEGGAVVASLGSTVSAKSCSFLGNRASYGGALYADLGSTVLVELSQLVANEAMFGSCSFIGLGSVFNLSSSCVSSHLAKFDRAPIILEGANGFFSSTSFSSNRGQTGGVIYILNSSSTVVENCSVNNNSAILFGGFAAAVSSNVTVRGGMFENVFAGVSAGVFYVVNYADVAPSFVTFDDVKFLNNGLALAGWGGVIYLSSVKQATFRQCTFTGNKAASGGVVAVAWGDRGVLALTDCVVVNNSASGDGGSVFAYNTDILVQNTTVQMSVAASGSGGAVWMQQASVLKVVNSTFSENSASQHGGAIGGLNSTVFVQGSGFIDNRAAKGGAVQVAGTFDQQFHQIRESTFLHNEAQSGGALHLSDSAPFNGTRVTECDFASNSALSSGGAVFFEPLQTAGSFLWTCLGCNLTNNSARGYGNNYASVPYKLIADIFIPPDHVISSGSQVRVDFWLEDQLRNTVNDASYSVKLDVDSNLVISGSNPSYTWPALGKVTFTVTFGIRDPSDAWKSFGCYLFAATSTVGVPVTLVPALNFSVIVGDCGLGEQPSGSSASCQPCLATQYLLDTNSTCQPCPEGRSPCADRSNVGNYTVLSGFWVLPCLHDPRFLTTCISSHCANLTCRRECTPQNRSCVTTCHNIDGGLDHCATNYEGNFCSRCRCNLSNGTCAYRDMFGDCTPCHTSETSDVLLFVSVVLAVALFASVVVFEQSNPFLLGAELIVALFLMVVNSYGHWLIAIMLKVLGLTVLATTDSASNGPIKVLVFYVQMTNGIVQQRMWRDWFMWIAARMGILSLEVSGLECFFQIFSDDAFSFGMQLLTPWILLGFVVLTILLRQLVLLLLRKFRCCNRKWSRKLFLSQVGYGDAGSSVREGQQLIGAVSAEFVSEDEAHLISESQQQNEQNDVEAAPSLEHLQEPPLERLRKDSSPANVRHLIYKAFLFVFYIAYFDLANTIFAVFHCESPVPDGFAMNLNETRCIQPLYGLMDYMVSSPWIYCQYSFDRPDYLIMFVLACVFLVVYVIGIFALFAWLLYKRRVQIRDEERHIAFMSFLYSDYKPRFYWFELVWMSRRVLLSVAVTLLRPSNPIQSFLVISILSWSLASELHLQPFKDNLENGLEVMVLVTLLFSYAGANTEILADRIVGANSATLTNTAFSGFLAALNIIVLVGFASRCAKTLDFYFSSKNSHMLFQTWVKSLSTETLTI
jgi:hypothetical protein